MKLKKSIFVVIFSIIVIFSLSTIMVAEAYYNLPLDVGNHHSYGGGGGGHSGGHSGGGYSSHDSTIDSDLEFFLLAFAPVIIALLVYLLMIVTYDRSTSKILDFMKKNDESFNAEGLIKYIKDIFILREKALSQFDLRTIRSIETDEAFASHESWLNEYIHTGEKDCIRKIEVQKVKLTKYVRDEKSEYLSVLIDAQFQVQGVAWTKLFDKDNANKLLNSYTEIIKKHNKPSKRKRNNRNYNDDSLTIEKHIGNINPRYCITLTRHRRKNSRDNTCPFCGAKFKLNSFGKCIYCGSVVNWTISDIHIDSSSSRKSYKNCIVLLDEEQKDNKN